MKLWTRNNSIFIVFLATILCIMFSACSEKTGESQSASSVNDYTLVNKEGSQYIVFDNFAKYENGESNQIADLQFESLKELRDTVTQGKLSDWQKNVVASAFPKDETGTIVCDFNNLYEPVLPEGWAITSVYWAGPYYSFEIASDSSFGFITWLPEPLYSETFQRDYTDFFDNELITVTKTENEGGKERTFFSTQNGELMQERYVLSDGTRTDTVDKQYFLNIGSELISDSEDVPVSVTLYCEEGEELFYTVMLYKFGSAPDDQLLKQFSMTPFDGSWKTQIKTLKNAPLAGARTEVLEIGKEYIFCTSSSKNVAGIEYEINPSQFALDVSSAEAKNIVDSFK